ncbi:hypothetical protein D8Y20_00125 [Mariprofundus sp. EBB-1]|nr:hypothetical protein D8Y20_00125 [Mariprofundus sp. EBB-1]
MNMVVITINTGMAIRLKMSDVRCQMSDVRCQMSDVRCRMSDVGCRMSDVGCRMNCADYTCILHLTSSVLRSSHV